MNSKNDHLRVTIGIRNNRLIEAREQLGLSPREAAEAIGIGYGLLLKYESLSDSPISIKRGRAGDNDDWIKPSARAICDYYGLSPDWFWEGDIATISKAVKRQITMSVDEAKQISSESMPSLIADKSIQKDILNAAIDRLTEREARIIRMRYFQGISLSSVAEEIHVSRERIRQIEMKALSKIRHGRLNDELRETWE